MKNTNRKGFTIVELVIVIAVIAILAAVLIPTFVGLVNKANLAADQQVAKNMNTALATYSAENGTPETFDEVLEAIEKAGYVLANLNAKAEGNLYAWDSANNQIVYISAEGEVIYKNADFDKANLKFVVDGETTLPAGFTDVAKVDMTKPEGPKALKAAIEDGKSVTLGADIELVSTIVIPSNVTIDLAGYKLDASAITNRPFEVLEEAEIVINATDSEIISATFGIIDIKNGANCKLTINGGNFVSDTDWGAVIKVRKGSTADVTLNNVTITDAHKSFPDRYNALIMNEGTLNLTVNGGTFTGNMGFCGATNATIKDATFNTTGVAVYAVNGTVENCKFNIGAYEDGNTPTAAVATSNNGSVTVTNCEITTESVAFDVYPTGGTITITESEITGTQVRERNMNSNDIRAKITIDGTTVFER